jgi:hypothetical protein
MPRKRDDFSQEALKLFQLLRVNRYAGPSLEGQLVAKIQDELYSAFQGGQEQASRARTLFSRALMMPYMPGKDAEWDELRADMLDFLKGKPEKVPETTEIVGMVETSPVPTKALVQLMRGDFEGLPEMPGPSEECEPEQPRPRVGIYKDCPWPSHRMDCKCAKEAEEK